MSRRLLLIALTLVALTIFPAAAVQSGPPSKDKGALKELMQEWAMCAVHGDSEDMEKFMTGNFRLSAGCISFDKNSLKAALKSGQLKVGGWTIDDVSVSINGNLALASGRRTLSNATFMGEDLSGKWVFTDRFEKQKDGIWLTVSSQSRRIKRPSDSFTILRSGNSLITQNVP